MRKTLKSLLLAALVLSASAAQAALKVMTCEPEWAALVTELAGELAEVSSATTALQDAHRIQARPSLIARARNADLLVCTGAELEVGWLPLLQRQAGNAAIQSGRSGYFAAADHVKLLEKPARLDRADGDVHPDGNPHLIGNPHNLLPVAEALSRRLAELDPAHAAQYEARRLDFIERWRRAIVLWQQQARGLLGVPVVVQHKNMSYLADWLGLKVVADLEPKPGIDPSAAYLARLVAQLSQQPARMVLRAAYQPEQASNWLAQQLAIKAVTLPYTVGGSPAARDLFGLYGETIRLLMEALR